MSISPELAQLELAIRLRNRRRELKMTTAEVAEYLGFTRNYLSGVENGRSVMAVDKLQRLMRLFEYGASEMREIAELLEATKQASWLVEYAGMLDDDVIQFFGYESGASKIFNYEGLLIPGLLQTRDYAEAVIGADARTSPATVNKRWDLRRKRQSRLEDETPLELLALISEGALVQHFGDSTVLRDQLDFLVGAIDRLADTVEVRVLPFNRSPFGLTGASTILLLDFASPHLPMTAWREAVTPMGFSDDPLEVETLWVSFNQALDQSSLGREESLELIKEKMAALE